MERLKPMESLSLATMSSLVMNQVLKSLVTSLVLMNLMKNQVLKNWAKKLAMSLAMEQELTNLALTQKTTMTNQMKKLESWLFQLKKQGRSKELKSR